MSNLTFIVACLISLLLPVLGAGSLVAQKVQSEAFDKRLKSLLDFNVPTITVEKAFEEKQKYVFLDARERAEYEISHIQDALHVGYENFSIDAVDHLDTTVSLVVYCSVGYRSEKIGEQLEKLGYSAVFNLYGSIFEWVNRGHPIFDAKGKETVVLHTYNRRWSQWVTHPGIQKTW